MGNKKDELTVISKQSVYTLLLDYFLSILASLLAILFIRWLSPPFSGFQTFIYKWLLLSFIASVIGLYVLKVNKIVLAHFSFRNVSRIFKAVLIKTALLSLCILLNFFLGVPPRILWLILLLDFLISLALEVFVKALIVATAEDMRRSPESLFDKIPVLVYGTSSKAVAMVARFKESNHYNILGFFSTDQSKAGMVFANRKVYSCSSADEFDRLVNATGVRAIMFARTDELEREKDKLNLFKERGIHILLSPRIDEVQLSDEVETASEGSVAVVTDASYIFDGMSSVERGMKRMLDFIVASCCLVVFSPLFLICYIAIKREDGGPAIFKQERIGRFGTPFYMYKFRSMRTDAESSGPALASGEKDERLTKVGRFLRAHHLDELPQLWNVFKGEMAFVGPRPERKYYIDQIIARDPRYVFLYQIRPGVTSYATFYNGYTDSIEKMLKRLEYDLYYLRNRSFWLDAKVLWMTFQSIVFGKKF